MQKEVDFVLKNVKYPRAEASKHRFRQEQVIIASYETILCRVRYTGGVQKQAGAVLCIENSQPAGARLCFVVAKGGGTQKQEYVLLKRKW